MISSNFRIITAIFLGAQMFPMFVIFTWNKTSENTWLYQSCCYHPTIHQHCVGARVRVPGPCNQHFSMALEANLSFMTHLLWRPLFTALSIFHLVRPRKHMSIYWYEPVTSILMFTRNPFIHVLTFEKLLVWQKTDKNVVLSSYYQHVSLALQQLTLCEWGQIAQPFKFVLAKIVHCIL